MDNKKQWKIGEMPQKTLYRELIYWQYIYSAVKEMYPPF